MPKAKSFFLIILFCLNFFYAPQLSAAPKNLFLASLNFKPGELLVKFKNTSDIYKFKFETAADLQKIIFDYQKNSAVEYVELNYLYQMTAFPNDPNYNKQTYLVDISAKDGWSEELVAKEGKAVKEVTIAILDSGVDTDHPDLADNIWVNGAEKRDGIDNDQNGYVDDVSGWDFVENIPDPNPKFEPGFLKEGIDHGTIIAGIAAASGHNSLGVTGLSWKAKIMPLRVLNSQGSGTAYDVYYAIDYAISKKVDVINMSFVGFDYSQSLRDIIKRAADSGIVMVAAAGNTDAKISGINLNSKKVYPVCYDYYDKQNYIIGVASISPSQKKSDFSNFGGDCIDVSAPGENFYSTLFYDPSKTDFINLYGGYYSGTSLSAPLAAGLAAIIKSLRPDFTPAQIIEIITAATDDIAKYNPGYSTSLGAGKLNVYKAVLAAINYESQQNINLKSSGSFIFAGLGFGSFPQVKVFQSDLTEFKSFFAYAPTFFGAVNIAAGDINHDGIAEIITGAGPGGGPHVRVFDLEGRVLNQFFAYDKNLRGGVNVALGDVNGDGPLEIIVSPAKNQKPEVKVFKPNGILLSSFYAYSEDFTGGVNVAAGDINHDGIAEIITGAGPGGGPHVRVFDYQGRVLTQFFPFNQNSRGGVNVALGDVNGDGRAEIAAAISDNAMPIVRVFSFNNWKMLSEFFVYETNYLGGLNLAISDLDSDGYAEIITGPNFGKSALIKIFNWAGVLKNEFNAYSAGYQGGVRVSGVISK